MLNSLMCKFDKCLFLSGSGKITSFGDYYGKQCDGFIQIVANDFSYCLNSLLRK